MKYNNLNMIVAVNKADVIGDGGKMLWHIPEELAHFKRTTMHGTLIIGRKTYDAMKHLLPLEGRDVVVLTGSVSELEHVAVLNDANDVLKMIEGNPDTTYWLAGGAAMYEIFFPFCSTAVISIVDNHMKGDTSLSNFSSIYADEKFMVESITTFNLFTTYVLRMI